MKIRNFKILQIVVFTLALAACDNVDEGYRIDYKESPAQFSATLLTSDRGAINDTISVSLKVVSEYEIKSLVVSSTASGGEGTGYYIDSSSIDPFIDHAYGTIQPGTYDLEVIYNYIVDQDTVNNNLTFIMVDEYGKKTASFEIITVPAIVRYDNITLYTNTSSKTDGLSTTDGVVYPNLEEYAELSVANEAVQKSLDIIFLSGSESSMLVAPYNGSFSSSMGVKNKTLFKLIQGVTAEDFDNLTNATLSAITEENEVKKGSTAVSNIKVGDIIGFRTDFASSNPYHYGLLRINAIHPTIVDYYEGTSYMLEMDVVTQK